MSTTVEEVLAFQHQGLRKLTHKIVYLAIRNRQTETGWASLSLNDFRATTGISTTGLINILAKLQSLGLIEKNRDGLHRNDKTRYRTTEI